MEQIIQDIEDETAMGKVKAIDVFRSMLNQPDMIAINSIQRTENDPSSFSSFTINLPRPVLQADTVQLVNANIPNAVQNIPNTATTFWYYRLSEYSGTTPNPDNLYFVRLLPSTYRQEFITNPQLYGMNKTFNSYQELADELTKSCSVDLGYYNSNVYESLINIAYDFPFLPNEITLPYNSTINKFQMIGTNATSWAYRQYSSLTTYAIDDIVYQGTKTYKSLNASNTNNSPDISPTFWVQIYVDIVATYSNTTPYPTGRYVSYTNLLYISILPTTGNLPTNITYWTEITEPPINYRYLVAGYDDPNVAFLQSNNLRTWNQYALYEATNIVLYNGLYYEAIFQNQNTIPTNATFWSVSGVPPFTIGLNACSTACDMVENNPTVGFYQPFPVGIAGQPYNPTPKRLLNSILGFTWNGVMNVGKLTSIPIVSIIASNDTDLFNRLRPVPVYIVGVPSPLLGLAQSTASQTYTAEGYANLVYSSILSIYATIMGGSTVDTQENTGLLAMTSINCANLGVSFFAPFINNPLTIFTGDLYSITFEFKDEFGEPFVFTNNAVVSLVMKVMYNKSVIIDK
jgi:hypothetical protein